MAALPPGPWGHVANYYPFCGKKLSLAAVNSHGHQDIINIRAFFLNGKIVKKR